jgi:hypothetical protein
MPFPYERLMDNGLHTVASAGYRSARGAPGIGVGVGANAWVSKPKLKHGADVWEVGQSRFRLLYSMEKQLIVWKPGT